MSFFLLQRIQQFQVNSIEYKLISCFLHYKSIRKKIDLVFLYIWLNGSRFIPYSSIPVIIEYNNNFFGVGVDVFISLPYK